MHVLVNLKGLKAKDTLGKHMIHLGMYLPPHKLESISSVPSEPGHLLARSRGRVQQHTGGALCLRSHNELESVCIDHCQHSNWV